MDLDRFVVGGKVSVIDGSAKLDDINGSKPVPAVTQVGMRSNPYRPPFTFARMAGIELRRSPMEGRQNNARPSCCLVFAKWPTADGGNARGELLTGRSQEGT